MKYQSFGTFSGFNTLFYYMNCLQLLSAPDGYYFINCYVRVLSILLESEHVVCAGFHPSVKNVRTPTVNIYDFA